MYVTRLTFKIPVYPGVPYVNPLSVPPPPPLFLLRQGLSNGVPVVTLPANLVRGRFALAMYRQMGYTDLVAEDVEVRLQYRPTQVSFGYGW